MTLVAVAPRNNVPGWNSPERPGRANALEVVELREALERIYETDAHMVMYMVPGIKRHHRINLEGFDSYPHAAVVTCFVADWDRPGHDEWPPDSEGEIRALIAEWRRTCPLLKHAAIFSTRCGLRIVQPLLVAIPVAEALPYFQHWYARLTHEYGIALDQKCASSINRLWRLGNVRRVLADGRAVDLMAAVMDLEPMRPIEPPQPPQEEVERHQTPSRASRRRVPRPPVPKKQAADVGEPWKWRVPIIAKACQDEAGVWHDLFLALAGALLDKQAPPTQLVALIRAIAVQTGADTRVEDREMAALTTLRRYEDGLYYAGFARLRERWRDVAVALDDSLRICTEADLASYLGKEAPETPQRDLEAILGEVKRAVTEPPDGVSLLAADPGTGKTHAVIADARIRAERGLQSLAKGGKRVPLGCKTAISVDKHELGIQTKGKLEEDGGPLVRRLFGPLSLRRDDGTPECRYYDVAKLLVAGGQSMQWELCEGRGKERCEFYDECRARRGCEGPDSALITIGPHALVSALASEAGTTGLLVIDEAPALLGVKPVTLDEIRTARQALSEFEWRFAAAMRPALESFEWWLQLGPAAKICDPREVVRQYVDRIDRTDLWYAQVQTNLRESMDLADFAKEAVPEDGKRRSGPPLRREAVFRAKRNLGLARQLGAASRVLHVLHSSLTTDERATVWVDSHRAGGYALIFTQPNEGLLKALRREGATLVLDANAGVNRPIYTKLLGYEPPLDEHEPPDGRSIERTHLSTKKANRSAWFDGSQLRVSDSLVRAVAGLFKWADPNGPPRKLGVITMLAVEVALRCARNPDDEKLRQKWRDMGQDERELDRFSEQVGEQVRGWSGEIVFGHYGAIRGLNSMADVDLLATLGDPFPNVGDVANEVFFADIDISERARAEQHCAGELKQAHGRIRPVHRIKPGRALHIGRVRPEGRAWATGVEQRQLGAGRAPNAEVLPSEALEHLLKEFGGLRPAARALGCGKSTLQRYVTGEVSPPASFAEVVSELR